jgi:uncharacterized protein
VQCLLLGAALAQTVVAAGPGHATPPPPAQVAADCDAPTYASDLLVCRDAALRALDRRLRDAWDGAQPHLQTASTGLVEGQDAWFRRRSLCAFSARHAACLRAAYAERIAVLQALRSVAAGPSGAAARVACPDAPWGPGGLRSVRPARGTLVVIDAASAPRAVAVDAAPRDDWVPFLRYRIDGRTLLLLPSDGPAIACVVQGR